MSQQATSAQGTGSMAGLKEAYQLDQYTPFAEAAGGLSYRP